MKTKLIAFFLLALIACKKEETAQPKKSQSATPTNNVKLVISSPVLSSNVVGYYYNPDKTFFAKEVSFNLNKGDSLIAYVIGSCKTLVDTNGVPYSWYSDEVQIDYYYNGTLMQSVKGNGIWLNYYSDFKVWLRTKI